jgi:D-sedoheptulose 7-phosphate isomerase
MTTSGRSENIAKAVEAARERGLRVIYLCGADLPRVEADVIISVPSVKPPRVQELHTLIIHLLAGAVEEGFAG